MSEEQEPKPEAKEPEEKVPEGKPPEPEKSDVHETNFSNWWWGVIPAVLAIGLLGMWLTGQYEEIFGIDPRGNWKGVPIENLNLLEEGYQGSMPVKRDRWELLIKDVAGDPWLKVTRNGDEMLSGPVGIEDNTIVTENVLGSFNGVYTTDSIRFRYNPFSKRKIEAVIRISDKGAYSILFVRE